ncbi:GNAT family N-acetyltransferase [Novilysobacter erysipheiresistens]|uniref:GNAT family N-acetyltransferase n=1 Tax=Novilysobacter erysipheiresistens TaxID=1749332 RepID=A0ABU7YWM1_9GAMM
MTPVTAFQSASAGHPANQSVNVRTVVGEAIGVHVDDIAGLWGTVLGDWPYLYDGQAEHGADLPLPHLQACVQSWRSVAVLAFDGDNLVGAATGLPLADAPGSVQRAFAAVGLDATRVFLCGESVLLPGYRGRGIGHRFFDERESHARLIGGFDLTAFCAVERAADDPRRPPFGRGYEPFWRKRGYRPREGLQLMLGWNEVGAGIVPHRLAGWLRPLERSR